MVAAGVRRSDLTQPHHLAAEVDVRLAPVRDVRAGELHRGEDLGDLRREAGEHLDELVELRLELFELRRVVDDCRAPTAISDVEELFAARLILEPPLMSALAGTLTKDELERMHEQLELMAATVDRTTDFQVAHRDFCLVAAADYSSPFIADIVIRVHRHLFRHQQIYLSRPRVPADILSLDRLLLAALERGDADAARRVYEFHLIELALGMVLDVDPDHRFDVLPRVAAANGITIEIESDQRIARPTRLRWLSPHSMPALTTANLFYEPSARSG